MISTKKLNTFGFSEDDIIGTTKLPSAYNSYAQKNAEQFFTVNKNLPKETFYQTLYWTRHQWAGRGKTIEITEYVDIPRKRYHRDYYSPYSVEFTFSKDQKGITLISEPIENTPNNEEKILNTINMVLALFGECELTSDTDPLLPKRPKITRVNWEILPKGKYPWDKIKDSIETISRKYNKSNREMMLRNCKYINEQQPDFIAYGTAGFKGYMIFGFTERNLYVLESMFPNNATYVFEGDWEYLSKLSKAEILSEKLHKARIIHTSKWVENFNEIMS